MFQRNMRHAAGFRVPLLLAVLVSAIANVRADTNLAVICGDVSFKGKPVAASWCSPQTFGKPAGDVLVRAAPAASTLYSDASNAWTPWSAVVSQYVEVCTKDKPPGADVATGECDASGSGWGLMAKVSRAQVAGAVIGNGTATVTWKAPTQTTDGKTLAAVDSYRIWYGTLTNPSTYVEVPGSVLSYMITHLPPGDYFFAVTALAAGTESGMSAQASKTIPKDNVSPPKPPSDVTVSALDAFDLVKATDKVSMKKIGIAGAGAKYLPGVIAQVNDGKTYCGVPQKSVTFVGKTKVSISYVICN